MRNKLLIAIPLIALLVGIGLAYLLKEKPQLGGSVDLIANPSLKLKTIPDKIIGQIEYEPGLIGYGYITNEIPFEPYGNFIEIQSKRTGIKREYLKGYREDGRPIYVAKIVPSFANWQDPITQRWYQYEKATTTKGAFEQQMGISFESKSILFKTAFGASTSTYPLPTEYGDGSLRVHTRTGFAAVHAETTADDAYDTDAIGRSGGYYVDTNAWQGSRAHFFLNTNVGAGNEVASSTFHTALANAYGGVACSNESGYGIEINIYESTSGNTTSITTSDYGAVKILNGDIVLSATTTIAQLNATGLNNYQHYTGNEAMNNLIETNITGITRLSTREAKYDATNNAPAGGGGGQYNVCGMYFSDQAGQSLDPYLEFEYSPPSVSSIPSIESDFILFE